MYSDLKFYRRSILNVLRLLAIGHFFIGCFVFHILNFKWFLIEEFSVFSILTRYV